MLNVVFDREVFSHLTSFQLMISLMNFNSLDMVFMGCIFCADDIVLLSGNCYGLQKIIDKCSDHRLNDSSDSVNGDL